VGGPVPSAGPHHGRVTSFDRRRGIGTVARDGAGDVFDFQATAIADGSRTIAVGAEVSFSVVPGHRGRYEARSLVLLSASHQRPA
jgi:cold shock CspA family protein